MALTLDASIGGVNSNSYATEADGDAYHDLRLFVTAWTGAATADKEAALVWASQQLDYHFDWTGSKFTIEQAMRWPRFGALDRDGQLIDSAELPQEIINAVSELARLLIGTDRAAETGVEGIQKLKVSVIELEFDKHDRIQTIPDEVYQMISHLGRLRTFSVSGGQVVAVPLWRT